MKLWSSQATYNTNTFKQSNRQTKTRNPYKWRWIGFFQFLFDYVCASILRDTLSVAEKNVHGAYRIDFLKTHFPLLFVTQFDSSTWYTSSNRIGTFSSRFHNVRFHFLSFGVADVELYSITLSLKHVNQWVWSAQTKDREKKPVSFINKIPFHIVINAL